MSAAPPAARDRERLPALLSWSTGKDSAHALHEVRSAGRFEVVGLLTTVSLDTGRVSTHGVREELLERHAKSLDLPLIQIPIPTPCPNDVYDRAMASALRQPRAEGIRHVVFGDLFLEDIRSYRESRMAAVGMECVFPLWGRDTRSLAHEMIGAGLEARLSCVDAKRLDRSFAGRPFDEKLLASLPPGVDPCGENGEFHTFVTAGPMFATPIPVRVGDIVERDGFVFADLLPS